MKESIFSSTVGQKSILGRSWKPAIFTGVALALPRQILNSGRLDVLGNHIASFALPNFFLGHVDDFVYPVISGLVGQRISGGKAPIWLFPALNFALFSGLEIGQGISNAHGFDLGFDYGDFAAFALGSITVAGIDIATRIHASRNGLVN